MAFESLTDEALLRVLNEIANACVRVVQMPLADRLKPKKGGVSPEQAGTLSAVFAYQLHREAERRGLSRIQSESLLPASSVNEEPQ